MRFSYFKKTDVNKQTNKQAANTNNLTDNIS